MSFWATWLPFGYIRASASARAEAMSSGTIEAVESPKDAATLIADGRQTKGALPLEGGQLDAAIYSSRGRGYARYNEDAAGLFKDAKGRIYAMAFDQAGGLGGRIRGRASALAAWHLVESCRTFATDDSVSDPTHFLLHGFLAAHKELLERNEGEVTTAIAAVIDGDTAHLMNSGDSGAVLFDARGEIKDRTVMHEFPPPNAGCLRHALGLEPEGCKPTPYVWTLEPGDWIVMGSDGLLDSGIVEEEMGGILTAASSAEDAINRVCTLALRRMGTLRAKPDNLTVVAMCDRR